MSIVEELADLEVRGRLRTLKTVRALGPVHGEWQGRRVALFCTNDYLGLRFHPRVIERVASVVADMGWGSGSARLLAGTSPWHAQLERSLAEFTGQPRALVFATGFMANLGAVCALLEKGDWVLLDKLSHASLIDACRLSGAQIRVFPHRNVERARELLRRAPRSGKKLVVTDSVFSMDGDLAPLTELAHLKQTFGAELLVDEAHGIGVFGERGSGLAESLGLSREVDVYVGTLSKTLGGLGGFVASSEDRIAWLLNRARSFIYATALPPAACAGALEALSILREEPERRQRLRENVRFLRGAFAREGWSVEGGESPILPLIVGAEEHAVRLSEFLLQRGFYCPAIRPPSVPPGTSRLRISVSSEHTQADLERLVNALGDAQREGPLEFRLVTLKENS